MRDRDVLVLAVPSDDSAVVMGESREGLMFMQEMFGRNDAPHTIESKMINPLLEQLRERCLRYSFTSGC